jgi:methylmalonyl-CoA mutase
MTDEFLSLSAGFGGADETRWRKAVDAALRQAPFERLVTRRPGAPAIQPLYREPDHPSARDPKGVPGTEPFLRGGEAVRDRHLAWDIRQGFSHPDPGVSNGEILHDLERGVSSVELRLDPRGQAGIAATDASALETLLDGVIASIAPVALDHVDGPGLNAAALLALWAETHAQPEVQRFAFNLDPLGALARTGLVEGGLTRAFQRTAELTSTLALRFPGSSALRVDARPVHEAGGSEAQELAALISHGVDTLRRLDGFGVAPDLAAPQMVFTLAVDAHYGLAMAKLRAARRLWARCLDALDLERRAMRLQAVTSARMLTRYDPWVNMLRGTAACFAGAVGGADIVTVRAFNSALGVPDALGRRVARNTQIIAMEESHLGRVADPPGGAWAIEALADRLAEAAWAEFQVIEGEGGYGESLMGDAFQARVGAVRVDRGRAIARREMELTGVSAYPLLDEVAAPHARISIPETAAETISAEGLKALLPYLSDASGEESLAEPFWPVRLAEPFERLRDHAEAKTRENGTRPSVFLATLGPLADYTARADFARNLFAAGGLGAVEAPEPPEGGTGLAAAFRASGCRLAVLCGSDARYAEEAEAAARALKAAGAVRVYLAGRPGAHETAWRAAGIDSFVHVGVDAVETLELAHAELGMGA